MNSLPPATQDGTDFATRDGQKQIHHQPQYSKNGIFPENIK